MYFSIQTHDIGNIKDYLTLHKFSNALQKFKNHDTDYILIPLIIFSCPFDLNTVNFTY